MFFIILINQNFLNNNYRSLSILDSTILNINMNKLNKKYIIYSTISTPLFYFKNVSTSYVIN